MFRKTRNNKIIIVSFFVICWNNFTYNFSELQESRDYMEKIDIIKSITERTGGEIYLGVVGAVRTGKSTFIN